MAHTKAGGSTSNVRDSQAQRLGVKKFGGQKVIPGNIIVRQRGTKFQAGKGTRLGKDYTIFATVAGAVKFTAKKIIRFTGALKKTKIVSVVANKKTS
ncbi:MAG: 50S ribosomal protein L27 [Candidatus Kerfeldbacteria bacterium RIFOXYA2_FULL_38_24]|uniref:Large ribosomal subunit protein bL27 n=1 Tax=Candidatus Kerfeldbacteria bacterium RIFOXYB2_FULL_38_14 TaxID=1798547 RepID=A0A1G2B9E2_9BACT|nr:MAG: 50S ribosomal protein L27 [Candidatus Kerfeldbacteria bacterium RIFOXYA2_FULL_38_24]OGY85833.1 MAG: 50S ribosomal protein L27 [Candidatus Kerfeldbacteria bacterium RIFOXYB2_FULL_38_14]OGY89127.1 MAG: 50S ribosomal protein L27 [Candidatus Kerfeldbacteria bacterium RIFOXYC2_FULL_38_9]